MRKCKIDTASKFCETRMVEPLDSFSLFYDEDFNEKNINFDGMKRHTLLDNIEI